jgi:hypothetical protein
MPLGVATRSSRVIRHEPTHTADVKHSLAADDKDTNDYLFAGRVLFRKSYYVPCCLLPPPTQSLCSFAERNFSADSNLVGLVS